MTPNETHVDDEILDVDGACRFIGGERKPIHAATLYRGVKAGIYSKPFKASPNSNRWTKSQLKADLQALNAKHDVAA